jgi:hypothetical protein
VEKSCDVPIFEVGGSAGTRGRKVGWTIAEPGRFHGIDQSIRYEVDDGGGRGEDGMM